MARSSDVVLILAAFIFPPAAAAFLTGCSCDLLINLCLTVLGYFPGLLHAFWLIYKRMQAEERYGYGGFIYTGSGQYHPADSQQYPAAPGYGAVHQG